MNSTTKICGDCRFYRPEHSGSDTGFCHVNPPVIVGEVLLHRMRAELPDVDPFDTFYNSQVFLNSCEVPAVWHDYPACRLFEAGEQS